MGNMLKKETDSHKHVGPGVEGGGGRVHLVVYCVLTTSTHTEQYEDHSLASGRLIRTLGWI